jgi:hypothetical protein
VGRRIDSKTIEEVISLFKTSMTDLEISKNFDVSVSYVNKLRSSQKRLGFIDKPLDENLKSNNEFVVVDDLSSLDEIRVLELKINSLKQTLKWYEELLSFKKEKNKKK